MSRDLTDDVDMVNSPPHYIGAGGSRPEVSMANDSKSPPPPKWPPPPPNTASTKGDATGRPKPQASPRSESEPSQAAMIGVFVYCGLVASLPITLVTGAIVAGYLGHTKDAADAVYTLTCWASGVVGGYMLGRVVS